MGWSSVLGHGYMTLSLKEEMFMKRMFALLLALSMALAMTPVFAEEDVVVLKVAHIGPTTGAAALYGQATLNGAIIAAQEINEMGTTSKSPSTPLTPRWTPMPRSSWAPPPPSPARLSAPWPTWSACSC